MFLLSLMSSVIKHQINSGLVLWCLTPRSTLFRAHLRARFELTFIVVIGTDCTGNCNVSILVYARCLNIVFTYNSVYSKELEIEDTTDTRQATSYLNSVTLKPIQIIKRE
jgi:hypothetical protein